MSPIDGRLIAVKDNICTGESPTTCGSGILDGFPSPFIATVVERLKLGGAVIAGTTNMDEFGMGSDSVYSHFGAVKNSYSKDLSAGGSSGGSAVAVATQQCHAAVGTDTGGSVRLPAAYNGIVGFKPSYGMISRWGVVAYANSLDTVGILASNVADTRDLFTAICGHDTRDPTSLDDRTQAIITNRLAEHVFSIERGNPKLRIGVPQEYNPRELQPAIRNKWICILQTLQENGLSVQPVSLPTTKMALSAYYILAPAEASSNLAKFDGARYGNKAAEPRNPNSGLFSKTRGHGLGEEVKRRILLGAYSLSAGAINNYFIQAQKIRRLVQQDFNNAFSFPHPLIESTVDKEEERRKVDVIITPTAQSLPPKISDIQASTDINTYSTDVMTVPASLAGLPAISVPVPLTEHARLAGSFPTTMGIQVIGQFGSDMRVLEMGQMIEKLYEK